MQTHYFSGVNGKQWIIPAAEYGALVQTLSKRFKWKQARARHELDDVMDQVWYLYVQARKDVEPRVIWSEIVILLVRKKLGKYESHRALAPYITKCVRPILHKTIGVIDVGNAGRDPDRLRQRLASATYHIIQDSETGDRHDGPAGPRGRRLIDDDDPLSILLRIEAENEAFDGAERITRKRDYLLPLSLRAAGKSVHDLPAAREDRRRSKNPWRQLVDLDPGKVQSHNQAMQSKNAQGKAMRRRLTLAGIRMWERDTGVKIPCDMVKMYTTLAVAWQGQRRNPDQDGKLRKCVTLARIAGLQW